MRENDKGSGEAGREDLTLSEGEKEEDVGSKHFGLQ